MSRARRSSQLSVSFGLPGSFGLSGPLASSLWLIVVVATSIVATSCGDGDKRDRFYGTDVGAGYMIPDGGINPALPDGSATTREDAATDGGDAHTTDATTDSQGG